MARGDREGAAQLPGAKTGPAGVESLPPAGALMLADLHIFGVPSFEALSGRLPHTGNSFFREPDGFLIRK
jgi:hypothetical protein